MRFVLLLLLIVAGPALAARVEVPVRVSLGTLRTALENELGATSYRDGRCRYLRLGAPRLESADGRLRLAIPGRGALGMELGGGCQGAGSWRGTVRLDLEPRIDRAGRLRVRVVDSNLWEFAKRHVHARIERFAYDLAGPLEMLPPAAQGIQLLRPRIEPAHVAIPVAIEVPDAWTFAPAPPSGAPLTEAELEALENALEPWDAFLVYVVRHAALEGVDSALRQRLFTLLLESRYQFVALLSGEAVASDPVRALFLDAWTELREILSPRYTLLVDAGDVLAALQTAAPGLPLTADGLRQLARTLGPATGGADPLAYGWSVDRELGSAFGIEETSATEPPAAVPPTRSWLDFVVPRAHADTALDRWVPTRAELPAYESRIAALLRHASSSNLPPPYASVYRHLLPTAALIESCWRQYVVRGGKVTYLRSQSSSVGIMQINQRVWRGFYDMERVRWDTAYNIRAGAQILLRYLTDYAIPFAERTGNPDHVARAAYAVYNAGPRAVGRFIKSPPHPREARVDGKLWTLYRDIAAGGDVDLATCGVKAPE